jgi:hypothetical protein
MEEDKYQITLPHEPEKTQLAQHPREQRRATIAILIAIIASGFTGWQAWEARQARIDARTAANQARDDSKRTFELQAHGAPRIHTTDTGTEVNFVLIASVASREKWICVPVDNVM